MRAVKNKSYIMVSGGDNSEFVSNDDKPAPFYPQGQSA